MGINAELVSEYQIAKSALEIAKERFAKIENALCQDMLTSQIKTDVVTVGDRDWKVTVVQNETVSIDAKGLEEFLGKRNFKKLCTYKIDQKGVEHGIKAPDIPLTAESASAFVTINPSKPYVRISKYTGEGDDAA